MQLRQVGHSDLARLFTQVGMSQGTGMDQSLLEAQICLFRAQLKASQGTAKYIAIERMVGEVGALATASNGREDGDSSANGLVIAIKIFSMPMLVKSRSSRRGSHRTNS